MRHALCALRFFALADFSCLTARELPASSSEWNSQFVHPLSESIGVQPQNLCSSSWPVDLATGHL